MKAIFLLAIYFFISGNSIFCQCPDPGLKIESQDCGIPQNLIVRSFTCSLMQVNWSGNKNQTYVLKATTTDPSTNIRSEAKTSAVSCDKNGNCSATIFVKEGLVTSWSVQALCVVENATFYSAEAKGADAAIPICPKVIGAPVNNDSLPAKDIHVYPNPSTGYLIVEYSNKTEGNIKFRVFDAGGKQVFNKLESASTDTRYKLDLRSLVNGIYILEVNNEKKINVMKFEIFRK